MELPAGLESIGSYAFGCINLRSVTFKGKPTTIAKSAFSAGINNLSDIYVPWSDGEVANAPWGATYATIHYNCTAE